MLVVERVPVGATGSSPPGARERRRAPLLVRETQEMVFDAHDKAFAFFGGACARGIYDNIKTAVDTIFVGKDRAYNRRFQQMCGHFGRHHRRGEGTEMQHRGPAVKIWW